MTLVIGEPPDFRFGAQVADLDALIRRLGQSGKPTHLVGISMGAAVALRAALDSGLPVRSLTLIRPAFSEVPLPANLRVLARIGELLRLHDPARACTEFAIDGAYREVAAVSRLAAASLLTQFDAPHTTERSVRLRSVPRNIAYPNLGEVASITAPTLVVGTERDPVHPCPLAREWSRGIPSATFSVIPPRDDDPALSAAMLRRLIQAHLVSHLAASWT